MAGKRKFQIGDKVLVETLCSSLSDRYKTWEGVKGVVVDHHILPIGRASYGHSQSEYRIYDPETGKSRWIYSDQLVKLGDEAEKGKEVIVVDSPLVHYLGQRGKIEAGSKTGCIRVRPEGFDFTIRARSKDVLEPADPLVRDRLYRSADRHTKMLLDADYRSKFREKLIQEIGSKFSDIDPLGRSRILGLISPVDY